MAVEKPPETRSYMILRRGEAADADATATLATNFIDVNPVKSNRVTFLFAAKKNPTAAI